MHWYKVCWFKKLNNKGARTFIKFDIEEFYPAITLDILTQSLNWAKQFCDISDLDINTILLSRKSVLFNNDDVWVKKNNLECFDVTMGSYDGAQICELVGLFILNKLSTIVNKEDYGLYRDDGLAAIPNLSGPEAERLKKRFIKIFKDIGFKIEIVCNLTQTDFLDVNFNLIDSSFYPYSKPNNDTMYVNSDSNHPPNILKMLPKMINDRLCSISSNENEFNKVKTYYEGKLKNAGYNNELNFTPNNNLDNNKSKNRSRNILWYNPPFSKNVKTNLAKMFLKLIDKHFPKNNKFNKIFNKNNVKVSYCSMPNMKNVINQHNFKILNGTADNFEQGCNCPKNDKNNCPLDGNCQADDIIYKAHVTTDNDKVEYIGSCSTTFKKRLYTHRHSFKNIERRKDTELSNYIWDLNDGKKSYEIKWELITKSKSYSLGSKFCNLCLTEKMFILNSDKSKTINNRDLLTKCRHKTKFKLANLK